MSHPPRLMAALFAASLLFHADLAAAGTPEEDLTEGGRAYDRGEYRAAIALLRPLLVPRIVLSSQEQAIRARKLLGLSYLFEKEEEEAQKQFLAILSLRPDHRFDPLLDPAAAVEFFEGIKRRNAERLEAIRERERQEALRRQQQQAQKRDDESEEARRRNYLLVRTVEKRPFWVNFAPLGAGQFQNGHRAKGITLLTLQSVLGALSLGTYLGLRFGYEDGLVPADRWAQAQALKVTQIVSGATCLALVAYGIIDALAYHEPVTVSERWIKRKPNKEKKKREEEQNKSSLLLAPMVGPNTAGLNMGFSF